MQKSFIVLYFCFHVTIILFHATFFSLYHFIEASKMARVSTHPTFVYAKIFCLSVCLSVKKYKECRFATALDDTDKENIRKTLLKDSVSHARTYTQCGSDGRKSGYNNVNNHFPKFFFVHKF